MDLLVRTIRHGAPDGVGHSESIPRWGMGSRAALGLLSAIAFIAPVALLSAIVTSHGNATADNRLLGMGVAMVVFHALLVLFFISFVRQNPRIHGQQTLWLGGLLLAAPITLPAYWWMHIWNAPVVGNRHVDDDAPDRVAGDPT